VLTKIVSAISDLVSDANFDCRKQGMSLQQMDSSHVALVSLLLRAEGFEHWTCEDSCHLGMHLDHLMNILRCMHSKDSLELCQKNSMDELDFIFKSPNEDRVAHFSLKLMEIVSDRLGIPETDYQTSVEIPSFEFMRICRDLGSFGDTLTINVTKEEVSFSAVGDIGKGVMSLRKSTASGGQDLEVTIIDSRGDISQAFALRYLQLFTKATSLSKSVTLRMNQATPLLVEYKMDDLGFIRYYLAPKIEQE